MEYQTITNPLKSFAFQGVCLFEELFSDAGQGETKIAIEPYNCTVKRNLKFQRRDAPN